MYNNDLAEDIRRAATTQGRSSRPVDRKEAQPLKLNILSDLHLGFGGLDRPVNDAAVVIQAGNIARPGEAVAWALRFEKPVLYVLGNHESHGTSIEGAADGVKRLCNGTQTQVLDNTETVIDRVRFLGTTLRNDFELFGGGEKKATAMVEARCLIRDFSRNALVEATNAVFSPEDLVALFKRHVGWLDDRLAAVHDGPTVVITHHAPSRRSMHLRFAGSLMIACFLSDAERLNTRNFKLIADT